MKRGDKDKKPCTCSWWLVWFYAASCLCKNNKINKNLNLLLLQKRFYLVPSILPESLFHNFMILINILFKISKSRIFAKETLFYPFQTSYCTRKNGSYLITKKNICLVNVKPRRSQLKSTGLPTKDEISTTTI